MKLILVLFALCFVSQILAQEDPCSPGCFPCEKITNASSCVNSDSEIVRAFSQKQEVSKRDNELQYCATIFFNHICVIVDITNWGNFFDNVTISITVDKITVFTFETTLPDLMEDGGVCLDDNTVIEILLLIPSLRNDTLTFLKLLEATGCQPRGIFSLCFYFTPCSYTNVMPQIQNGQQPTQQQAQLDVFPCGCFSLDFQLLYWRDYCIYSDATQIGCVA